MRYPANPSPFPFVLLTPILPVVVWSLTSFDLPPTRAPSSVARARTGAGAGGGAETVRRRRVPSWRARLSGRDGFVVFGGVAEAGAEAEEAGGWFGGGAEEGGAVEGSEGEDRRARLGGRLGGCG